MKDDDRMITMERYDIGFLYPPPEQIMPENGRFYYLISTPDDRAPLTKEQQELIIRVVAEMRKRNNYYDQKIKLMVWPD